MAIRRPPTATQLVDVISPLMEIAQLAVPPPISQESMVLFSKAERWVAPDPMAAITLSKLGPADAATNLPASLDSAATICLAFCFLAVSQV